MTPLIYKLASQVPWIRHWSHTYPTKHTDTHPLIYRNHTYTRPHTKNYNQHCQKDSQKVYGFIHLTMMATFRKGNAICP